MPEMEQKAAAPSTSSKQAEGVISGLRAHLKSLGQEATPEVESYLAKCLGNGPQVIKQASQRLEASGKTAAKLKVELAQLSANWTKFQKRLEEEYNAQKQKFLEKQKQLKEGLTKAEEEYAAAKDALRDAATLSGQVEEPNVTTKPTETPSTEVNMEATPQKRKPEVENVEDVEDPVLKRLKSPIKVDESPIKLNTLDFR